jgi:cell division protein FtsW (lipid II flippase)
LLPHEWPFVSLGIAHEPGVSLARGSAAWPRIAEASLVLIIVASLLPWFNRLAGDDLGRDRRFGEAALAVRGLPSPVLPSLCASHGGLAEPIVRERLCRRTELTVTADLSRMPPALTDARQRTRTAFLAPLRDTQSRLGQLRLQQGEGLADLLVLGNAIEATEAELLPFVSRYSLEGPDGTGPMPMECAFDRVEGSLERETGAASSHRETARANALLLLGAAFDGHAATGVVADVAMLPVEAVRGKGPCGALRLADVFAQTAALMSGARQAPDISAKNEAMRDLLRSAGWQWAGWMLAGFGLLQLARRSIPPALGISLALATWAVLAWAGRVPWPLAAERAFVPGRGSIGWFTAPAPFALWLLGCAGIVLVLSGWLGRQLQAGPEAMASRVGYPGLVLMTGIGWLLLLDLSANGHFGNRYLALYHQGHLWLGMLILSVLVFLRQPIGRLLGWCLSVLEGVTSAIGSRLSAGWAAVGLLCLLLLVVGGVGSSLTNIRQLTSELGRVWLIVGAAWFFYLRGTPLAERMARGDGSMLSLVRYVWPLWFVVLALIGTMVVTRDMGPLLIAGYGAGAFVAASVAMWWHQRHRATYPAFAIAVALFVLWILGTTFALFELGSLDDVTAARLENLAAPTASANDQLALVRWFQSAAPPSGFGLGNVPWCGYAVAKGCAGVPAQIQSDYTFTALVGAFGWTFAWAMTLGCAVWLHRLVRHHGRVTRGEPRLVMAGDRVVNDDQAFLSWLAVAWVVLALCQLAVTVAGNLAVLPLTGVTFPFVSFGMTSLLVNLAMLSLCLHINLPSGSESA